MWSVQVTTRIYVIPASVVFRLGWKMSGTRHVDPEAPLVEVLLRDRVPGLLRRGAADGVVHQPDDLSLFEPDPRLDSVRRAQGQLAGGLAVHLFGDRLERRAALPLHE